MLAHVDPTGVIALGAGSSAATPPAANAAGVLVDVVRATLATLALAVVTGGLAGLVTVATLRQVTGHRLYGSRERTVGTGAALGGGLLVAYLALVAVEGSTGPPGGLDPAAGMGLVALVVAVVAAAFVVAGRRSAAAESRVGISDLGVGVVAFGTTYLLALAVASPLLSAAVAAIPTVG